jgi:hypothetical protein
MTDASARCPYLVPVTADRLWMYPTEGYCSRPDAPVRVPANETVARVCLSNRHLQCPGYLAVPASGESPCG